MLGELFAPLQFEPEIRLDSNLGLLSQLSKDQDATKDLLNLFRPISLSDSLSSSLSELANQALKLFDFSQSNNTSSNWQKLNNAQDLLLSQLNSHDLRQSYSVLSANAAVLSDNSFLSAVGQTASSPANITRINDVVIPPQTFSNALRQESSQQAQANGNPYRSASPFEAIRRPYEKARLIKEERKTSKNAAGLSLLFKAVRQFVSGILPAPNT